MEEMNKKGKIQESKKERSKQEHKGRKTDRDKLTE